MDYLDNVVFSCESVRWKKYYILEERYDASEVNFLKLRLTIKYWSRAAIAWDDGPNRHLYQCIFLFSDFSFTFRGSHYAFYQIHDFLDFWHLLHLSWNQGLWKVASKRLWKCWQLEWRKKTVKGGCSHVYISLLTLAKWGLLTIWQSHSSCPIFP